MNKSQIIQKLAKNGWASLTQKEKDIYNSVDMREIIYEEAIKCLGKNMAPINKSLGCVEAVNNIAIRAIGNSLGGGYSTYWLYNALTTSKRFKKIKEPLRGDIVISPSGFGNGKLSNGHVGICGELDTIMSNDSAKLLWLKNYTIDSWKKRYFTKGGFPVDFFRVIS